LKVGLSGILLKRAFPVLGPFDIYLCKYAYSGEQGQKGPKPERPLPERPNIRKAQYNI